MGFVTPEKLERPSVTNSLNLSGGVSPILTYFRKLSPVL